MLRGLDVVHDAASRFEADGAGIFKAVAKSAGIEIAQALLVSYLRRSLGSTASWPVRSELKEQVDDIIRKEYPALYALASQPIASFYMGEWYVFDNFSAFAVMFGGRLVPTVEHAYQASKYRNPKIVREIANAPSAHEAKKIGGCPQYQSEVRPDWNPETKVSVMRSFLADKRCRHEYVRRVLARSRGLYLVEDSPEDVFWGRGPNFNGENWLGRLWMEQRELL